MLVSPSYKTNYVHHKTDNTYLKLEYLKETLSNIWFAFISQENSDNAS